MTDTKLIDSSVWIAYLFEGICRNEIESSQPLLISPLSLFEIKLKLLKKRLSQNEINEKMQFVKSKSIIIQLSEEIAEQAAKISSENSLPAIDSLIYATAQLNDAVTITLDNHFRSLKGVYIPQVI